MDYLTYITKQKDLKDYRTVYKKLVEISFMVNDIIFNSDLNLRSKDIRKLIELSNKNSELLRYYQYEVESIVKQVYIEYDTIKRDENK